jgi:hypothetical protein
MQRSELVTVPSFSPQPAAGRTVGGPTIADDNKRTGGERGTYARGARHADSRVSAGDPQRLEAAVQHLVEQVDGFKTWPSSNPRRFPEAAHAVDVCGVRKVHMDCKLAGETADLAPAHRVRLAGK